MRNKTVILIIVLIAAGLAGYFGFDFLKSRVGYNAPPLEELPPNGELDFLNLPEGFSISVFAENLSGPRVIAFDPSGRLLVSEPKEGRVVMAESKEVVIDGLNKPHGLAFFNDGQTDYLYIAETHQVVRYPYDVESGTIILTTGVNIASLPPDGRHFTRTITFGPNYRTSQIIGGSSVNTLADVKLYISVGSSCDTCVEDTWKRAAILEADPEGTFTAEFAGGLRNAVFFTFHPRTGEIWATEMGRDNLGDNLPPDEINIVRVAGPEHEFGARRYGWPFCYGDKVRDNTFNPGNVQRIDIPKNCSQTESPIIELQAHSAPLGLAFITPDNWPSNLRNDILVAYHGSWNRTEPTGYKVVRFDLDDQGNVIGAEENFISGWLNDSGKIFGRPVDLKFGPDGNLYISDDTAGVIYKVSPK